jgi:hypothetical protein
MVQLDPGVVIFLFEEVDLVFGEGFEEGDG